jgi:hypothetical protein
MKVIKSDIVVDDEIRRLRWSDLNLKIDQCEFISIRDIKRDHSEHVSSWIDDEWWLNSYLAKWSIRCSSTVSHVYTSYMWYDIVIWYCDINNLFDLKIRSFFSFNKHVSLKQFISKQIVNSSRTQWSRSYERKYQNDFFFRNNAIKRFFRVFNMTNRNAKSTDFHEFLTLRRSRRAFKLNNSDRRNLDRKAFQRFRSIINIKESQKIQNRQSQDDSDHSKSIKMQRSKFFEERDQRH